MKDINDEAQQSISLLSSQLQEIEKERDNYKDAALGQDTLVDVITQRN